MNNPLLSILIPTTPDRHLQTNTLLTKIIGGDYDCDLYTHPTWKLTCGRYVSRNAPFEVLVYLDNKEMTIGEKRELLYRGAKGLYSWQLDSDDDISDNAIDKILNRLAIYSPDCVTFQEHCMINGAHYKSNHSLQYGGWEGDGQRELSDGFHYHRTPFMKSVIKTEIAISVPIPHIRFGEDHQWSQLLNHHLVTEEHIDEDIYFYQHISSPHNERYGIR